MAYVKVMYSGSSDEEKAAALEAALKVFKRKVDREGILRELKDREEFLPKSKERRIKLKEAIKRERIKNKKRNRRFK